MVVQIFPIANAAEGMARNSPEKVQAQQGTEGKMQINQTTDKKKKKNSELFIQGQHF